MQGLRNVNNRKTRPLVQRAADIYLESLGARDVEYTHQTNACALVLGLEGDPPRARTLLEKELGIVEATLGKLDPRYADGLRTLAGSYLNQGAFAQAEPLYRKVVEVAREAHGENHPEHWLALRNLLQLYSRKFAVTEVRTADEIPAPGTRKGDQQ